MRIHIVRHGQTSWNAQRRIQGQLESALDETGRQQATQRGADFRDLPLVAVYSSSSVRTRQTTELILGTRDEHVHFRDDLREVNLGAWQGHFWSDIERDHPEQVELHRTASPEFTVDGAETSQRLQHRGVSAIEAIIDEHPALAPDANILIVSHGAIMKCILAHYAGIELAVIHHLPPLANCAHCIIDVQAAERRVVQVAGLAFDQTPWASAHLLGSDASGPAAEMAAV